jgi:hypothetical protein
MTDNHNHYGFQNQVIGVHDRMPTASFRSKRAIGRQSTSLAKVRSNEYWDTIEVPPIVVAFDYHNHRSTAFLGQASSLAHSL